MIIQSAIKKNGVVWTGRRHSDIFLQVKESGLPRETLHNAVQGFITDKGKFLNRYQAARYAFKHGQIKNKIELLISEDLW
jgi:hypothetical protein